MMQSDITMASKRIKVRTTVSLDADLMEWLRAKAADGRCSVAYVVQSLIVQARASERSARPGDRKGG